MTLNKDELADKVKKSYKQVRENTLARMVDDKTDYMYYRIAWCYEIKEELLERLTNEDYYESDRAVEEIEMLIKRHGELGFVEGLFEDIEDHDFESMSERIGAVIENLMYKD